MDTAAFGASSATQEKLRAFAPAYFAARLLPLAPAGPALQIASDWNYWALRFDDEYCDAEIQPGDLIPVLGKLVRVVEVPGLTVFDANPHIRALRDLAQRAERHLSPVLMRRWSEALRRWAQATQWQVANRAAGRQPSLGEFCLFRGEASYAPQLTVLIEIANGIELTEAEILHPAVRALTELTWLYVGWSNDLMSSYKEALQHEDDQSVLSVVAGELPGTPVQQGMALCDRLMCLYLALREDIRPAAGEALCRYVDDLGNFMRAQLEWGASQQRYTLSADASEATVVLTPHRTEHADLAPLPIPEISWWWDQLPPGAGGAR
ncbi:terpene synthase family protein [Streptomyces sp. GESEQ-35]|uniref:terpene synthase family protein n=1 Tax=Streptomyces sp. GESEQ-35 TaxID=2812657 RepID=UPI001B33DAAA|nr:terpene synthase family protein [Streptomyces sp. GESEQ-35]